MTPYLIAASYLAAGAGTSIWVLAKHGPSGTLGRTSTAGLALVLWPFLLPVLAGSGGEGEGEAAAAAAPPPPDRLTEIADRLRKDLARSRASFDEAAGDERGRRLVERFVERLRAEQARLVEMEGALADARPTVRPRLLALRDGTRAELDRGIAVLEEMAAQLTLLRFSDAREGAAARAERTHIEDLLASIEAVVEVSAA